MTAPVRQIPETWFESAASLLREPDPGPTPFLVDQLIADGAIAAIQGQPKVGKTWAVLEMATAIVTGKPAFGHFTVPQPGPVFVVLEESGRAALQRRLAAITRGAGIDWPELLGLYVAPNRRVRLDDPEWRERLIEDVAAKEVRAVFFDPIVRLKGSTVDENSQQQMAGVLDFMRDLRDATGAAVVFTHHTGHSASRLRGTSDLEAYWESKVTLGAKDGKTILHAEHREAEATATFAYRLVADESAQSVEFIGSEGRDEELTRLVLGYLAGHPGLTTEEIRKAVGKRKADVLAVLVGNSGRNTDRRCSERRDKRGRTYIVDEWFPCNGAGSPLFPENGNTRERPRSTAVGVPGFPTSRWEPGTAGQPATSPRPLLSTDVVSVEAEGSDPA